MQKGDPKELNFGGLEKYWNDGFTMFTPWITVIKMSK